MSLAIRYSVISSAPLIFGIFSPRVARVSRRRFPPSVAHRLPQYRFTYIHVKDMAPFPPVQRYLRPLKTYLPRHLAASSQNLKPIPLLWEICPSGVGANVRPKGGREQEPVANAANLQSREET